jgi:hypothetical protein
MKQRRKTTLSVHSRAVRTEAADCPRQSSRTVRDRVGLSAGQNPKNTLTGKCSDLGREHNDGLSAGCTGLSVGQSLENKPRRTGSGLCSAVNGGLSTVQKLRNTPKRRSSGHPLENNDRLSVLQDRTIRMSKDKKQTAKQQL